MTRRGERQIWCMLKRSFWSTRGHINRWISRNPIQHFSFFLFFLFSFFLSCSLFLFFLAVARGSYMRIMFCVKVLSSHFIKVVAKSKFLITEEMSVKGKVLQCFCWTAPAAITAVRHFRQKKITALESKAYTRRWLRRSLHIGWCQESAVVACVIT